jgi:hypothetical protein
MLHQGDERHIATVAVPDHVGSLVTEGTDQCGHIGGHLAKRVSTSGIIASPVATTVWDDHLELLR